MPIWFFPLLLGVGIFTTALSGVWLLLHLQAVATVFRKIPGITPAPTAPRASRSAVVAAMVIFNLSWIITVLTYVLLINGAAP